MTCVRVIGYHGITALTLVLRCPLLDPLGCFLTHNPLSSDRQAADRLHHARTLMQHVLPPSQLVPGTGLSTAPSLIDCARSSQATSRSTGIFSARSTPDGDTAFGTALEHADGSVILAALHKRVSRKQATKTRLRTVRLRGLRGPDGRAPSVFVPMTMAASAAS